ncbi:hypothetical protein MIPYR_40151 [uncultured Microbacterium sp.]|uniref:Uncharacterized protein n=1 Tax=uncultured Microbacterium sp. TaxID=191216 RepID=A0A1Y5PB89_9MICO|nr:hypothetical protein MIPYR_40151 [uncultured Microbacterium sp.]
MRGPDTRTLPLMNTRRNPTSARTQFPPRTRTSPPRKIGADFHPRRTVGVPAPHPHFAADEHRPPPHSPNPAPITRPYPTRRPNPATRPNPITRPNPTRRRTPRATHSGAARAGFRVTYTETPCRTGQWVAWSGRSRPRSARRWTPG